MRFCPKCGSMLSPSGDELKCRRCEYTEKRGRAPFISKELMQEKEMPIIEGEERAGLPTTKVRCSECGNNKAYWWLRQLRSADEGEVRFFRCTKCGKTWREYT